VVQNFGLVNALNWQLRNTSSDTSSENIFKQLNLSRRCSLIEQKERRKHVITNLERQAFELLKLLHLSVGNAPEPDTIPASN
jgi:hypothetical protein